MPFIRTKDEVSLFYNDWGTGKPIVLIHGWPVNGDMWEYQAPYLAAQGFRVVSYDRRGFGRSDQPWTGYVYDTLADDLAAVLDTLDLTEVTLVGFSMGAGEIARYLSRHGAARVAKAALICGVTPFLLQTSDHPEGIDRGVFDKIVDGLKEDRPHFLAGFFKLFYGAGLLHGGGVTHHDVSAEVLDWTLAMAMQASPKATVECVRAWSETDFRPDMKAFTVPTLVVHGTGDSTVPIDIAGRAAARMIPGAVLKEYEGSPHALPMTERDRLCADLVEFARL